MDLMHASSQCSVREGFQILLRASAETDVPLGKERIAAYYQQTAEACLRWAKEVEGERLRAAYLALSDNREKATFRTAQYHLICRPIWESESLVTWLCESVFRRYGQEPLRRRTAQTWVLAEETILPLRQLLRQLPPAGKVKHPPFRPDGVYPQDGELVFFRNARDQEPEKIFWLPYRKL